MSSATHQRGSILARRKAKRAATSVVAGIKSPTPFEHFRAQIIIEFLVQSARPDRTTPTEVLKDKDDNIDLNPDPIHKACHVAYDMIYDAFHRSGGLTSDNWIKNTCELLKASLPRQIETGLANYSRKGFRDLGFDTTEAAPLLELVESFLNLPPLDSMDLVDLDSAQREDLVEHLESQLIAAVAAPEPNEVLDGDITTTVFGRAIAGSPITDRPLLQRALRRSERLGRDELIASSLTSSSETDEGGFDLANQPDQTPTVLDHFEQPIADHLANVAFVLRSGHVPHLEDFLDCLFENSSDKGVPRQRAQAFAAEAFATYGTTYFGQFSRKRAESPTKWASINNQCLLDILEAHRLADPVRRIEEIAGGPDIRTRGVFEGLMWDLLLDIKALSVTRLELRKDEADSQGDKIASCIEHISDQVGDDPLNLVDQRNQFTRTQGKAPYRTIMRLITVHTDSSIVLAAARSDIDDILRNGPHESR